MHTPFTMVWLLNQGSATKIHNIAMTVQLELSTASNHVETERKDCNGQYQTKHAKQTLFMLVLSWQIKGSFFRAER